LNTFNKIIQAKNKATLTSTDKINSFKGKPNQCCGEPETKKKQNKVEISEVTKRCRLDKNLIDLILQYLSLLSKIIGKYFPSLKGFSSLDLVIDPFLSSSQQN
jgi:hypothetical protein